MKNNHNVKVYNNGFGYRIAFEVYTGTRLAIPVADVIKLKESLEYGIAEVASQQAVECVKTGECNCDGTGRSNSTAGCPIHGIKY